MENFVDSGYDYEWINTEKAKDYECPICKYVCKRPKKLPCGHLYCNSCIRRYIRAKMDNNNALACSVCRRRFVAASVEDDCRVGNFIAFELKHEVSCGAVISVASTANHKSECGVCKMLDGPSDMEEEVPVPVSSLSFVMERMPRICRKYSITHFRLDDKLFIRGSVSAMGEAKVEIATVVEEKNRLERPNDYAEEDDRSFVNYNNRGQGRSRPRRVVLPGGVTIYNVTDTVVDESGHATSVTFRNGTNTTNFYNVNGANVSSWGAGAQGNWRAGNSDQGWDDLEHNNRGSAHGGAGAPISARPRPANPPPRDQMPSKNLFFLRTMREALNEIPGVEMATSLDGIVDILTRNQPQLRDEYKKPRAHPVPQTFDQVFEVIATGDQHAISQLVFDLSLTNDDGDTVLMYLIKVGVLDYAKLLQSRVTQLFDARHKNKYGVNATQLAVKIGSVEAIEFLIKNGLFVEDDLERSNSNPSASLLQIACTYGQIDMLMYLVHTLKLSPFARDSSNNFPGDGRLFEIEGGQPKGPHPRTNECKNVLTYARNIQRARGF